MLKKTLRDFLDQKVERSIYKIRLTLHQEKLILALIPLMIILGFAHT
jgi:hypothetical protein